MSGILDILSQDSSPGPLDHTGSDLLTTEPMHSKDVIAIRNLEVAETREVEPAPGMKENNN